MVKTVNSEISARNTGAPYTKRGSIKLLSIANSWGDDSVKYLWNILNDTGLYDEIIIGHLYSGGCDTERHLASIEVGGKNYRYYFNDGGVWTHKNGVSSNEAIAERDWDVIVTQTAAKNSCPEGYVNVGAFFEKVKNLATNKGVVFCWNMTWASPEHDSDLEGLMKRIQKSAKEAVGALMGVSVIPTGTAIQNVRTSFIDGTLNRDRTHLELGIGCYTAALAYAGAVTGIDVDKINWTPEDQPEVAKRLHVIKECVKNALEHPFEITNSSYTEGDGFDFKKDADILRATGKDINKFDDVEIEWKDNLRYNPKKGAAPVKSNFHFATQLFSKDELPVGSVIIVDDLYAVTPVKYKTADGTEPDEDLSAYDTNLSSKKILYIDKDFWGDYNYVGFNISMYSDELPVSYGSHGGVRIYKAK